MTRSSPPTEAGKREVWDAYFRGQTTRIPVRLNTNPRVVLLDPSWNPDGITFHAAAHDPRTHVEIALRHELYRRRVVGARSDAPAELPERWAINMWSYNVFEAASLGAEILWPEDQVPTTRPFLEDNDLEDNDNDKRAIFDLPIDEPLELPFIRDGFAFWNEMERVCRDLRFEGRPVSLVPWDLTFTDGPLTVACSLRGGAFLLDLLTEPEYADELLSFITRAAILRRDAFWQHYGDRIPRGNGLADDSCALISPEMYRTRILPLHRTYFDAGPPDAVRTMHLCGDATRHFRTMHEELGITIFDTGYPVDHGWLRAQLGPDVEIYGGPEVALLLGGTPNEVYERAKSILDSGVKEGGRFVLQEGNNLPPCVPLENLEAMYLASLEHGWCDDAPEGRSQARE